MYAEAVNEIENGVTGINGAKAIEALRQVRSRAFTDAGKVESYLNKVSADKNTFLKAVLMSVSSNLLVKTCVGKIWYVIICMLKKSIILSCVIMV